LKNKRWLLLIFCFWGFSPQGVWNKDEPLNFSADKVTANKDKAELIGSAHVWQKALDFKADKIVLYQDSDSNFSKGEAFGKVVGRRLETKSKEWVTFFAERAVFNKQSSKIKLFGKVKVIKAKNIVRAAVVVYDLEKEVLSANVSKGQLLWTKKQTLENKK
jgi:lipopolysaccharide transport protein LptA